MGWVRVPPWTCDVKGHYRYAGTRVHARAPDNTRTGEEGRTFDAVRRGCARYPPSPRARRSEAVRGAASDCWTTTTTMDGGMDVADDGDDDDAWRTV